MPIWQQRLLSALALKLFHFKPLSRCEVCHHRLMKLMRLLCDKGDNPVILSLYGHLLLFRGADSGSREQGIEYLRRAALAGDSKAQHRLGCCYEMGIKGLLQANPQRAVGFYCQAAKAGHALSIERMARACREGELGVAVDLASAEQWQSQLPDLQSTAN